MTNLPFSVSIQPGKPAYEQVIQAVHRALADGRLKPGDAFPSVRTMSKEVRINPNTCHKVVHHLVQQGVLEVMPGRGTKVAAQTARSLEQRMEMIEGKLDDLIVEASRIGFTEEELLEAARKRWKQICKEE